MHLYLIKLFYHSYLVRTFCVLLTFQSTLVAGQEESTTCSGR